MINEASELLTIAGDSSLLFSSWDDNETVIYHCLSGDTHTLNPVATAIIRVLQERSVELPELFGLLSNKLNYHEDDDFRVYVEEVLVELNKTGLIETVSG